MIVSLQVQSLEFALMIMDVNMNGLKIIKMKKKMIMKGKHGKRLLLFFQL
jgi:hypothetical protein